MSDEQLMDAFSAWEELSQSPDTIKSNYLNAEANIVDAGRKAREDGLEEGRKEGRELEKTFCTRSIDQRGSV